MKRLISITIGMAFIFCLYVPVQADKMDPRSEEATNIVAGKVKQVKSYYATNKWGDELIMSEVTLKIDKTLKGERQDEVAFIVEGGEVGDTVLRVSTVPLFAEGETIVLYLKRKDSHFEYLDSKHGEKARPSPGLSCCKTFSKWTTTATVPFYINPNTTDMTGSCVNNEITGAATDWNSVSKINLQYAGTTSSTTVSSGGGNNIFFRSASSGSTIAVTYIWYKKSSGITAFDMVFYDSWAFFDLTHTCTAGCSSGFYLQPIAAHELGHAIGLDHNNCTDSLMYPYASYCDTDLISTYDTTCVQSLYGK